MHAEERPVADIVSRLQERFGEAPDTAVVLGSGLGVVVERMTEVRAEGYEALALPAPSAKGHAGRAVVGRLGTASVMALSGRVHLYEGYPAAVVVRAVRALHRWGVQHLVLTAAVGSLVDIPVGTLVSIEDHISFQRDNPLVGPAWVPERRFPDMSEAYHPGLRRVLGEDARALGIPLPTGVYAAMTGPAYETPAEIRMLGKVGGTVVGMSTVPEVLAAAEVGLRTAVIAVVTNPGAGLGTGAVAHDKVQEVAGQAGRSLADLLERSIPRFAGA